MHYGKGWRITGVMKWKFMQKGVLGLKLGMSIFPGQETIGSGLNEISGNHKTEIKIEMRVGF